MRRVAVVGGGAAGALVALNLLSRGSPLSPDAEIVVYDPRPTLGRGVAYSTPNPRHLLNVPAAQMSAFVARPDDFVRWSGRAAGEFAPRSEFGDYLCTRLEEAADRGSAVLRHTRDTVTTIGLARGGWRLRTSSGGESIADCVVLAVGNPPARIPEPLLPVVGSDVVVDDPWNPGALATVREGDHVVCLGTGLTFVDVALQLCEIPAVTVTGLSRHGLLPRRHGPSGNAPTVPPLETPLDALRWIRSFGDDWRAPMSTLRPLTSDMWRSFDERSRRQFLRHPMRYWEIHRHRLAPTVGEQLAELIGSARVNVGRGRIVSSEITSDGSVLMHTADRSIRADHVVFCTGGDDALMTSFGPVAGLISDGHARRAPLDMGIDVDADSGAVVSAAGRAVPGLYAVGSLRRGVQWETTAVPELRAQADRIVRDLHL